MPAVQLPQSMRLPQLVRVRPQPAPSCMQVVLGVSHMCVARLQTCGFEQPPHCAFLPRVQADEILASTLDALVYREYLDPHFTIPNTSKIVPSDVNEPVWSRRVHIHRIGVHPGTD